MVGEVEGRCRAEVLDVRLVSGHRKKHENSECAARTVVEIASCNEERALQAEEPAMRSAGVLAVAARAGRVVWTPSCVVDCHADNGSDSRGRCRQCLRAVDPV